jgi:putative flippase GtrA
MSGLGRHASRFLQVGAVGFAIDAGLLWFFIYQLGLPPILARGISFLVTISVTFVLNARYTFEVRAKPASMTRYLLVQSLGAVINFASYTWLVLYGPFGQRPLFALCVGSFLATINNFVLIRHFVFPNRGADSSD